MTFIEIGEKIDPETGEKISEGYRRPHTTTVFHVSQTEPTSERRYSSYRRRYQRRARWTSNAHNGEPIIRDPGEDAADRWNELHGDKPGFGEPIIREYRNEDGRGIVAFVLQVPPGFHAIRPELDRNDDA